MNVRIALLAGIALAGISTCSSNAGSTSRSHGSSTSSNNDTFGGLGTSTTSSTADTITTRFGKGQRAFAIPSDEGSAAGGWCLPGSSVDVILTEPRKEGHGTKTSTILQNVKVVAGGGLGAKGVVLALTPEEVQHVATALDTGHVRLALRSSAEGNANLTLAPDVSELEFIEAKK